MDKYDYKAIAAAKTLLEQALALVQEARESLDGADYEEYCVVNGKWKCEGIAEVIEDALKYMNHGMNSKELAEAKLEMVIGRCKEMYGNVHQSDLLCSLCEHDGKSESFCEGCASCNGAEGFRLRNPWKE